MSGTTGRAGITFGGDARNRVVKIGRERGGRSSFGQRQLRFERDGWVIDQLLQFPNERRKLVSRKQADIDAWRALPKESRWREFRRAAWWGRLCRATSHSTPGSDWKLPWRRVRRGRKCRASASTWRFPRPEAGQCAWKYAAGDGIKLHRGFVIADFFDRRRRDGRRDCLSWAWMRVRKFLWRLRPRSRELSR